MNTAVVPVYVRSVGNHLEKNQRCSGVDDADCDYDCILHVLWSPSVVFVIYQILYQQQIM